MTRLEQLKRYYPNVKISSFGIPPICPRELGLLECKNVFGVKTADCVKCWNEPAEGVTEYEQ